MSSGLSGLVRQNPRFLVYSLFTLAVLMSYGNSFRAGWHFDDIDHITQNKAIQINRISTDSIIEALYAAPRQEEDDPKNIFRPIASLTFALNWYLGKDDVFGYHVINILLHVISACLLFEVILSLYDSPGLRQLRGGAVGIAFSTAILWSLDPIQTQAVTYIVQRMASMAAMFFVLGLLLYVRGRLSHNLYNKALCYLAVAIAFALALASKENSIVLPAALLLVEAAFFSQNGYSKQFKMTLTLGAIAIGVGLCWIIYTNAGIGRVLGGYAIRPYTMFERLITQPRVLLFYVSLIFFPIPGRLSIQHDITHSTSLIDPWTTLLSVILVCVILACSLRYLRKYSILCFAILFFFLSHSVESTILPLELVFEHRNYLPSMFLFWPVSVFFLKIYEYLKSRSKAASCSMLSMLAILPLGMGLGTYERNLAWADGFSLWKDAASKSQKYDRPYINLAQLYDAQGNFEDALKMYAIANEKYSERKSDYQFVILNNTANIFFKLGDYDKAIEIWSYAVKNVKDNRIIRRNLAIVYAQKKEWEDAIYHINMAIDMSPRQADLYILKSEYLLETGRFSEATESIEVAAAYGYDKKAAKSAEAIVLYHMGEFEKSERIFKKHYSDSKSIEVLIWLFAINLNIDDMDDIIQYQNEIAKFATEKNLKNWINIVQDPSYYLSKDSRLVTELKKIHPIITDKN